MNKPIPYIIQGNNLVLVINNTSYNINKDTHANYYKILDSIKEGNWDDIQDLIDVGKAVTNYSKGKLKIVNGELMWDYRVFHNALSTRIISMYEQGFDVQPMINFMENLMLNPSYRAVEELYGFLEKNTLPITPDGCFMAYKRVSITSNGSFVDCYTKKIDNSIGNTVTMDRNLVNDDQSDTCSSGLHFCSLPYLTSSGFGSGGTILLIKINPKDVVSIPTDYNDQKGRCCSYDVMSEHGKNSEIEAFESVIYDQTPVHFDYMDDRTDSDDESDSDNEPVSIFKPI